MCWQEQDDKQEWKKVELEVVTYEMEPAHRIHGL